MRLPTSLQPEHYKVHLLLALLLTLLLALLSILLLLTLLALLLALLLTLLLTLFLSLHHQVHLIPFIVEDNFTIAGHVEILMNVSPTPHTNPLLSGAQSNRPKTGR